MRVAAFFTLLALMFSPAFAQDRSLVELTIKASVPKPASAMAFGFDALWTMSDGKLVRINAADNSVAEIAIPSGENAAMLMELDRYRGIAVGEGAVWIPDMANSQILKVDPARNEVIMSI